MLHAGSAMRIESIHLRDIGPFDDVTIDFPEGKDPQLADVYLLTGPSGCGKSTVLYAIAALIAGEQQSLGKNLLVPRVQGATSVAELRGIGTLHRMTWVARGESPRSSYVAPSLPVDGRGATPCFSEKGTFFSSEALPLCLYQLHASRVLDARHGMEFNWAAFSYSSMRSITDVRVSSIPNPRENHFDRSMGFDSPADSQALFHWVARQQFQRLKAKDEGNHERAEQIARGITDIEQAISDITGEDFGFVMANEDNDVRIGLSGAVLKTSVLPSGLQSIMSWIADLLMRLDR
jgi:energy-coupling factor transporter ATP-binding protein EcfA2